MRITNPQPFWGDVGMGWDENWIMRQKGNVLAKFMHQKEKEKEYSSVPKEVHMTIFLKETVTCEGERRSIIS